MEESRGELIKWGPRSAIDRDVNSLLTRYFEASCELSLAASRHLASDSRSGTPALCYPVIIVESRSPTFSSVAAWVCLHAKLNRCDLRAIP